MDSFGAIASFYRAARVKRDRPTADALVNEFFFDKKCGRNETHDAFFNWCMQAPALGGAIQDVVCSGVTGQSLPCKLDARFETLGKTTESSTVPGMTESTTVNGTKPTAYFQTVATTLSSALRKDSTKANGTVTTPAINDTTPVSTEATTIPGSSQGIGPATVSGRAIFHLEYKCQVGGSTEKLFTWKMNTELDEDILTRIVETCDQEINGIPYQMPLWLILLIILLVIMAVSGSAYIFWNMWLRRRIYGPGKGDLRSTFGSQWTSAPLSSNSALISSTGPSRVATSMHSRKPISSNRLASGIRSSQRTRGSSAVGSLDRPSRSGSIRARQPSLRSGMSRSHSTSSRARNRLSGQI